MVLLSVICTCIDTCACTCTCTLYLVGPDKLPTLALSSVLALISRENVCPLTINVLLIISTYKQGKPHNRGYYRIVLATVCCRVCCFSAAALTGVLTDRKASDLTINLFGESLAMCCYSVQLW